MCLNIEELFIALNLNSGGFNNSREIPYPLLQYSDITDENVRLVVICIDFIEWKRSDINQSEYQSRVEAITLVILLRLHRGGTIYSFVEKKVRGDFVSELEEIRWRRNARRLGNYKRLSDEWRERLNVEA